MFYPDCSTVSRGAPRLVPIDHRLVVSAPSLVTGAPWLVAGAPWHLAGAPRRSQALWWHPKASRWRSQMLPGAPKVLSGAPRCSQTSHNHSHGTFVPVIRDRSYSEGRQECPPGVWDSPKIDAYKFALHILTGTPGGFQWLKFILLKPQAMRCSTILNPTWRYELESWVIQLERLLKVTIQYSKLWVPKYWLYSYKQKNQICETLDAYLWSWIQGHIAKTDRVRLISVTIWCGSLRCSVLSPHNNCWHWVGAQLEEADAISLVVFLPVKAPAALIMGQRRCTVH